MIIHCMLANVLFILQTYRQVLISITADQHNMHRWKPPSNVINLLILNKHQLSRYIW